jgi:hypothetical protein
MSETSRREAFQETIARAQAAFLSGGRRRGIDELWRAEALARGDPELLVRLRAALDEAAPLVGQTKDFELLRRTTMEAGATTSSQKESFGNAGATAAAEAPDAVVIAVAGWYPDPGGEPHWRYWDGSAWTAHTTPMEEHGDADEPDRSMEAHGEVRLSSAEQEQSHQSVEENVANQPDTQDDVANIDRMLDQLTRLGELRTASVITDEEFAAQKARILDLYRVPR